MIDQDTLIRLLNQSGSHSGTVLGQALGVSRVAVQKKIQSLIENGLPIEAVPGKGYSLSSGVQLLDASSILAQIKDEKLLDSVDVFQTIASTNSYLLSQPVLSGRANVCLAEAQSSGRGRRGSEWQSSPYRNIMLSLSWGFDSWPATITGLGLAVALAVTEALNAEFDLDVKIKWPNDLMVLNSEGQATDKLAGVLIDVAGESSGACNVVIGLGLNVSQPDWSERGDSAYAWQDLRGLGVDVDRNALAAVIINALISMLSAFTDSGFTPMRDRWNALSSYAGKMIRVGDAQSAVVGEMLGVDASGALLVRGTNGVEHQFSESTVSVRLVT